MLTGAEFGYWGAVRMHAGYNMTARLDLSPGSALRSTACNAVASAHSAGHSTCYLVGVSVGTCAADSDSTRDQTETLELSVDGSS